MTASAEEQPEHRRRLFHPRWQPDRRARDGEGAVAAVVDCLRILAGWIDPGLDHFQHEEVVAVDHAGVDDAAFQAGVALGDQRRRHQRGRLRGQTEARELVGIAPAAVAANRSRKARLTRRVAIMSARLG